MNLKIEITILTKAFWLLCKTTKNHKQAVKDIISCLKEFKCDPFSYEKKTLHALQYGIPASDFLSIDFRGAKQNEVDKVK